ncbi:hypothetical protein SD77_0823 [Bacillus badius]|uniref:Uncharacterized protein n=1 Tax=Bacillus badius TaxID=1455 RepID=A0ABR5ATY1_BACBA|nr:hypothetical protein SD78_3928 [Bacillus badius]KIL78222.1 hypothetical protein SD77_0823 [Bacillus badius]
MRWIQTKGETTIEKAILFIIVRIVCSNSLLFIRVKLQ